MCFSLSVLQLQHLVLVLLTWLWHIVSEMTYGQWQPADSQCYVTLFIKAVNPLLPSNLSSQPEGQLIYIIVRAGSYVNVLFNASLLAFYDATGITFHCDMKEWQDGAKSSLKTCL